jgi:hypothetical protein
MKSVARLSVETLLFVICVIALIDAWGDARSARRESQRSKFEASAALREAADLREQLITRRAEPAEQQGKASAHDNELDAISKELESVQSQLVSTQQGAVQLQAVVRDLQTQVAKYERHISRFKSLIEGMLAPGHWRSSQPPTLSEVVNGGLRHTIIAHSADDAEFYAGLRLLLGRSLIASSQAGAAELLIVESVQDLSAEFGDHDPRTIEARIQLARCLANQGRFDDAVTQCMQALAASSVEPRRFRSHAQRARDVMLECAATGFMMENQPKEWQAFSK